MNPQLTLRTLPLILLFAAKALPADSLLFVPAESDLTELRVSGTSNIRDWDAESGEIKGTMEFKDNGFWEAGVGAEGSAPELVKGQVKINVETLNNSSRGLTTNLHKYMGIKKHPQVEFDVKGLKPIEAEKDGEEGLKGRHMEMKGRLTLNGVGKEITFPVELSREKDQLRITGRAEMKMTDFTIDPPRKMMGAIRAADEVTITFTWVLVRQKS